MLFLRIKQAEAALAGGRLDEACEMLRRDRRLREHCRGQQLVTRLVAALVERGRAHLAAERFAPALADGEKAGSLGGNLPDVAALRTLAAEALLDQNRVQRQAARAVAAARRRVDDGNLAAGERLLAPLVGQTSQAAVLMEDVAAKRETLQSALAAAEAALDANDVERAVAELSRARSSGATDPRIEPLSARAARVLCRRIGDAIEQGRLDLVASPQRLLSILNDGHAETEQLQRVVGQYRLAWDLIESGRLRQAEEVLRRLAQVSESASWTEQALRQIRQASDAIDALRAGPLGLLAIGSEQTMADPARAHATKISPPPIPKPGGPPPIPGAGGVPSTFLIRVDGVGSFLVLRQDKVTIGPVSSSRVPDVGLAADPSLPVVSVERIDDDYFLRSSAVPVTLNDRSTVGQSGRLLAGGDKIALSPRCRMTFGVPTPASTSAVLDLTGSRLPMADVRRVILMDRDLIIGPGAGSHVRTDAAGGSSGAGLVLHLRGGRLVCESKSEVTVDGRALDRNVGIPVGAHVKVGGLSFVITAA